MPTRDQVLLQMKQTGVVAVIRADSSETLVEVAEAIRAGGVVCLEVTMTTPNALGVIEQAVRRLGEQSIVGAGTVLDAETARAAILSGAEYIVSPILDLPTIQMAKRYGKAVIPGAFTPTEIVRAWESGADLVKVFPATKLGPEFFKDMRGPLPQIPLTPTGGVTLENAADFIRAGAATLGVGSAMVKKDLISRKDYDGLTKLAQQFIETVKIARAG
jgi:2-dehydro-3-deoxyphosphogluconate aldolase/(4S)-4-hydroxy-2-oxoglutarate aldolase